MHIAYRIKPAILSLILLFVFFSSTGSEAQDFKVSVSIKPLHSLVSMVMEGMGQPMLIMIDGASPHSSSLKPSQRRMMAQSEVIFVVHEGMETALSKSLKQSGASIFQVALFKELELLPRRRDEDFSKAQKVTDHHHDHEDHDHEDHDHDHDDAHSNHDEQESHDRHEEKHADDGNHDDAHSHDGMKSHDHDHGPGAVVDYHFWLDPLLAREVLMPVARALGEVYPENASIFIANAEKAYDRMGQLHVEIQQRLTAKKGQQFIVFHDAYQYFEKRYDLTVISSILDHHDAQITPSRLIRLRHLVEDHQADCIFAEPQYSLRLVEALATSGALPVLALDPIGRDIVPGSNLYPILMNDLADAVASCQS